MNDLGTKVYDILKQIPKGKVTTYKAIADKIGTKAYRAIGKVLNKNPNPIIVPCHRVIKSDGNISGFALGVDKKIELLKSEGVEVIDDKVLEKYILTQI